MLIREAVVIAIVVAVAAGFVYSIVKSMKSRKTAWSSEEQSDRKKLILKGIVLSIVFLVLAYLAVCGIWLVISQMT